MIQNTKITLSAKELELLCNTDWILTKHRLIEKVYGLFGNMAMVMQLAVKESFLAEEIKATTPKISRGENYNLLPYVMLDYPRYFNPENTMAIRTFFWWGNSISIHLLLSGANKANAINDLIQKFELLQKNDYAICIADTPWQHHFEEDNYIFCKNCTVDFFSGILNSKSFIKIGRRIGFDRWKRLLNLLKIVFFQ